MDSIFLLREEDRRRFFRGAGSVLRCSYICIWSPFPQHPPTNTCFFISKDGWHHEDGGGGPSSAVSSSKRLFDAYRSSLCNIRYHSCVPGWAYKCNLPYLELSNSDLIDLASNKVQRQFYQEAGIKTAIFLRCTSGEIELGMTASTNYESIHSSVQRIFSEEFILQQCQLPSSSSSSPSLPAAEICRHSLLPHHVLAMRAFSRHRDHLLLPPSARDEAAESRRHSPLPHRVLAMRAFSRHRDHLLLRSSARDEAAIAQAMLVVISSSSSFPAAALLTAPPPPPSPSTKRERRDSSFLGAFRPYEHRAVNLAAPKKSDAISDVIIDGQKMIKMMIEVLRRMRCLMQSAASSEAGGTAGINQHYSTHVISERKRREKLKESFHALRMLLPQEYSKKDKASVLFNTRDYLKALKFQVSELQERNRQMEMELKLRPRDDNSEEKNPAGDSKETVQVLIARPSESTSETLEINISVVVGEEVHCDVVDLLLGVLESLSLSLRQSGAALLSAEGISSAPTSPQRNACTRASVTVQVKPGDFDEESFKAAVIEAANDVLARSANPTA